jgi:hypothetical protein
MTSPLYPDELPTWRDDAACLGMDPDLFFPPRGGATKGADAKQICGGCPVQAECLEYALKTRPVYGIWGGLSLRERDKIRRTTRPQRVLEPCGTTAAYKRHLRKGEAPCGPCQDANRRAQWRNRKAATA